jgi:3-isopropylmalate dehydrogenase
MPHFSARKGIMSQTIGLIHGGGTGAELIASVRQCLVALEKRFGLSFQTIRFDDPAWERHMDEEKFHPGLYRELLDFYEHVRQRQGAIVRGSLPAPVLYKLRRELNQAAKIIPLNPHPDVSHHPRFRVILLRESIHGLYHCDAMNRQEDRVVVTAEWCRPTLGYLAERAFDLAETHPLQRVTTVLKTSVLGELGRMWLDAFEEESRRHPAVHYAHRPSGAGFSDMWLEPDRYGVVATDDQAGDILADLVPTVLYGSRNLVPAGNFSPAGHASFQTDHGTIMPLKGKGEVNPLAMIGALGMALRYTYGQPEAADALRQAVDTTLAQGYRTQDFYQGPPQAQLGTHAMTDKILENLLDGHLSVP